MQLGDIIKRMHRQYSGDTNYPVVNSTAWQMYRDIANDYQRQFATDKDNKWVSRFEERTFGKTNSTKLIYDLDDDVAHLSDSVYIDATNGNKSEYSVIKPKDRAAVTNAVFVAGSNPKQLNFTNIQTGDIGGTIRAGIYTIPDDMSASDDECAVDRPDWVILRGAAELAFNDPAKEDKFPDLIGLANEEWQKMVDANSTLPDNQPNSVPQAGFQRIGGSYN